MRHGSCAFLRGRATKERITIAGDIDAGEILQHAPTEHHYKEGVQLKEVILRHCILYID